MKTMPKRMLLTLTVAMPFFSTAVVAHDTQGAHASRHQAVRPAPSVDVSAELSVHGSWVRHARCGWVWRPSVSVSIGNWHPYSGRYGCWERRDGVSVWVSNFSWGPYVYHSGGRWMRLGGSWCWVPPAGWAYAPRVVRPVVVYSGGSCCSNPHGCIHRTPRYRLSRRHYRYGHCRRPDARPSYHSSQRRSSHGKTYHHVKQAPDRGHSSSSKPPSSSERSRTISVTSRNVRSGSRLDSLIKRHRGR